MASALTIVNERTGRPPRVIALEYKADAKRHVVRLAIETDKTRFIDAATALWGATVANTSRVCSYRGPSVNKQLNALSDGLSAMRWEYI